MSGTTDRAGRLYRRMLLLYPPEFERAFGAAMASDFERGLAKARGIGRAATTRFWLRVVGDWVVSVPREHWDTWTYERRDGTMGGWGMDMRSVMRRLMRSPVFALVTVLVLALGIGANTALFTALEAALFARPAYPDVDRIVLVDLLAISEPGAAPDTMSWSFPKYVTARDRFETLESLAGYARSTVTLTGVGSPERLDIEFVTPSYLAILGARPELGRLLATSEAVPAVATVVLLSHALWTSRFGADPSVIGRTVSLDGASLQIVGVVADDFRGLTGPADMWAPLAALDAVQGPRRLRMTWAHWLQAVGTTRPGVSLADVRADASRVGEAIDEAFPDPNGETVHDATVVPLLEARVNPVARRAVAAVAVAAVLFLLIACGNVASLILARASARRADTAVRVALGAGRARLLAEHLAESMLLSVVGGALGIAIAVGSQPLILSAIRYALDTSGSRGLVYLDPSAMQVGPATLAAGAGLALVIGLVFGAVPLLGWSGAATGESLRRAGGSTLGAGADWGDTARGALVPVQLALTVLLLAGAGLMGASLAKLASVETGFEHDAVLTLAYDRGPGFTADEHRVFMDDMLDRIGALPDVESASAVTCPPLAGPCEIVGLQRIDDDPAGREEGYGPLLAYAMTPGYFESIGTPVRSGRGPSLEDGPDDPPVVVVNETAVERYFDGASPIGRRIAITHEVTAERMATIVGVVADVRYGALEEGVLPAVYLAERQATMPYGSLVVRTAGDPYATLRAVRQAAATVSPDLPLSDVTTLGERRAGATARTRVILGLLTLFGASGLLLTALGLYGVVSHSVARRTRELGLRLALGADRSGLLSVMIVRPVGLAAGGVLAGVIGALLLGGLLGDLLFGISASDPGVLFAAAATLLIVATGAAWIPARRALRIDPSTALREH